LPSCFVGFVENAIGQLSPFPTDDLPSPKDLGDQISEMVSLGLKYGANVVAFKRPNYYQIMMYQMYGTWALAGKGGLMYPLKSATYRALQAASENIMRLNAVGQIIAAEINAIIKEYRAAQSGQCQ
jgi:hypothetical protein